MHLDLEADDVEAEVRRLEALGATRWDHQQERGFDFWVMRDPGKTNSASFNQTTPTSPLSTSHRMSNSLGAIPALIYIVAGIAATSWADTARWRPGVSHPCSRARSHRLHCRQSPHPDRVSSRETRSSSNREKIMTSNPIRNRLSAFSRHPVWSAVIAGIILAALGAAWGFSGHFLKKHTSSRAYSPSVIIRAPVPSATEPNSGFGANGFIYHKPAEMDAWLVVQSGGEYYPFKRLIPGNDNEWNIPTHEICTGTGAQTLQVYLVPKTADGELFTYSQNNTPNCTGLANMPARLYPGKAVANLCRVNRSSVQSMLTGRQWQVPL